jgi:hypothetical protein
MDRCELDRNWTNDPCIWWNCIAFDILVPLFYLLLCAAMLSMCMKGMDKVPETGSSNVPSIPIASPPASDVTG